MLARLKIMSASLGGFVVDISPLLNNRYKLIDWGRLLFREGI
jgi:hypothetical protein